MKHVTVIESAQELIDGFYANAKGGALENVFIPAQVSLEVGVIQNAWIGFDSDEYQIAPHVTFEQLFLELCKRMNINVKSTVIK